MDFNILDLAQYIKIHGSSENQSNDKLYNLGDGYEIRYIENDIISTLVFVKNNTRTTYIDLTTDFSIDIANARIYKSDNVFDLIDIYYEEYIAEKQKKRKESIEKQDKIEEFLKK
jgi:hypothetical protein